MEVVASVFASPNVQLRIKREKLAYVMVRYNDEPFASRQGPYTDWAIPPSSGCVRAEGYLRPYRGKTSTLGAQYLEAGKVRVLWGPTISEDFSGIRAECGPNSSSGVFDAILHNNQAELARILAEPKATVEIDAYGLTPLHWAACLGRAEACDTLIRSGAQLDATSPRGVTPLMVAVGAGQLRTVEILVSAGATRDKQIDGMDEAMRRARDLAKETSDHRMIALLQAPLSNR